MVETGALGQHSLGDFLIGSFIAEVWVFDYLNSTITVGTQDLKSNVVKTSSKQYTSVSLSVTNIPSEWDSNISYIITHDTGVITINNGETKTIPASNNIALSLRNTSGITYDVDMFTNTGKPIQLRLTYK